MRQEQINRDARRQARQQALPPLSLASATVSYNTQGHLLIAGAEDQIRLAAAQLKGMASITLYVTQAVQNSDEVQLQNALAAVPDMPLFRMPLHSVKGFMGQFEVQVAINGQYASLSQLAQHRTRFDLILDLSERPLFHSELAPAGYFHCHGDPDQLAQLLQQLPDYIGQFEKPRYFRINNDICAHSGRGQTGCTRCLDVCPADAISSIRQLINIDPHLCHGAGGCSTACPTGAISYALPQPSRIIDQIRDLLQAYYDADGSDAVIVLHDREAGRQLLESQFEQLPGNLLPVELEELAAAGQEIWLAALAMGASQVLLLDTPQQPASMRALLQREICITRAMLEGLNLAGIRLSLIDSTDLSLWQPPESAARFHSLALNPAAAKRDTLLSALDQLAAQTATQTKQSRDVLALPAGAPFGQVSIDRSRCTLCVSCVAVCPTQALTDGGETPALFFTERNCVQCGLCDAACPEDAIELQARLRLDPLRDQPLQLHQEPAFECLSCSKPFAPRSTVEKMLDKLAGHPMFQGEALNRLKMCEDCRVQDIYQDLTAHPEKQLEI
ncbi:4Fe-4S binding protein [Marinobacterium jannaschii]|uniref:4Fe-4S binding protein n=1 Tax=Marinobacterium jannaschii TaxID=64970 RepID=UPI000483F3F9|nr:4Fe-4S binding protein [Marinobacterium jannaschii]